MKTISGATGQAGAVSVIVTDDDGGQAQLSAGAASTVATFASGCKCIRARPGRFFRQNALGAPSIDLNTTEATLTIDLHLQEIVEDIYLGALSRLPTGEEQAAFARFLASAAAKPEERQSALEDILWTVVNTKEFMFTH